MSSLIQENCKLFVLSNALLKDVMYQLNKKIETGLNKETQVNATVQCFPTFLQDLPKGNERGKYLALVLGDTYIEVLMVRFEETSFSKVYDLYPVNEELRHGPGTQLFGYFAECLEKFVHVLGEQNEKFDLAFSFNFPVHYIGLARGTLIKWAKDFSCENVVGRNVACLLQQAIHDRPNLQITVVALVNDATGCLLACAYNNRDCRIGVMVGLSFNASYVEKSERVGTFANELGKPYVVVNIEWGALGDHGALDIVQTEFDHLLDQQSVNPRQQTFEKMVSGFYMGEIVRLMMEKFTGEVILFNGKGSRQLSTQGILNVHDISAINNAKEGNDII